MQLLKKELGASVFCIWYHTEGQGNYINEKIHTNDIQNPRLIFVAIHHIDICAHCKKILYFLNCICIVYVCVFNYMVCRS